MTFEELLKPGFDYAHELLLAEDRFPPFAIILDGADSRSVLVAEDGSLLTLEAEIQKRNAQSPAKVVALFSEAEERDGDRIVNRLISVHVDVRNGINRLVLEPFQIAQGKLTTFRPRIVEAEARIIKSN